MPEAFDTGPLSWVKDEIDQSLKKVLASYQAVLDKPEDFASLRFTEAHLYQVSGALDMVGLEGCKRFCSEIEKITSKLEKQIIPVTEAVMTDVMHAVETLGQYLQELLNGMPDVPTRLYPSLKPIVEAQGEVLEESDLFFPDTTNSAPKSLPANPIDETTIPIFIAEQRTNFQKSLLDWLRTKDNEALNSMGRAIQNVQQVQQKNAQRTLWWAATAFNDALAQDKIAEQTGAKKLCRRLDQQLRNMSIGETKAPSQLLREVLYYVAISDRSSEAISHVKDVFELDALLPQDRSNSAHAVTSAVERAALAQLNAELPHLKDLWASISPTYSHDLEGFIEKLNNTASLQTNLNNQHVVKLFATVLATAQTLQTDQSKITETALIEMAAALNLLEYIGEHYQQLDAEVHQKINTQVLRLQSMMDGSELIAAVDAYATSKLDASVVDAVAKQILQALQIVEKSLDTFFRNQSAVTVLDEVTKPLQQVAAAFDMLEMPVPKAIARLSALYTEHFKQNAQQLDDSQFELVAESLSMLGIYADELPNTRAESEKALTGALQRLKQNAVLLGLTQDSMPDVDLVPESNISPEFNPMPEPAPESLDDFAEIDIQQDMDEQVIEFVTLESPTTVEDEPEVAASIESGAETVTDIALDPELQNIFLTEAEEVLAALAQLQQTLRVNATDSEALVEVRRAYHTLKGSGRTVGLSGMGEVAWSVEKLLNLLMERKTFPTPAQLAFIEKVSAAFAGWIDRLQSEQMVTLSPVLFLQEAAALEQDAGGVAIPAQQEEVLIGGTRKLSKAFFTIFTNEAQQHLQTLVASQATLQAGMDVLPSADSRRAAHTLGSNALAAGFKPIGELARAFEHWLDEHTSAWTEQHITLYANVVKALEEGLEKVKALKNPKSSRALIRALSESTENMQAVATQKAEAAVLDAAKKPGRKAKVKTDTVEHSITTADPIAPIPAITEPIAAAPISNDFPEIDLPKPDLAKQEEPPIAHSQDEDLKVNAVAEQAVDKELLGLFLEEARELVPQVGRDLRAWRASPQEAAFPDSLQRALHTLKGSARMAGQTNIGDSVHNMEDRVIRALKHKVTLDDFDDMFVEFDRIGYMLEDISGDVKVSAPTAEAPAKVTAPTRSTDRKAQFLRMRADVLDRLINEAGEVSIMRSRMDREMQNFKQSSSDLTDSITRLRSYLRELEIEAETQLQSRMSLLQEANEAFDPLEFDRFTRLQELTRMMAESVNDVATIQHGLLLNLDQTDAALQQQNRMNRELQQGLMGVRMLPFSTISERLQRIVRQTARELNKRVEMTIEGEGIEMDRGVLDKMGAPLEHLLRNAVAHGLEPTEERKRLGKSETGHIKLKVSTENDEITLIITDDGSGINLNKVKQKAIDNGMFAADQELSDQALMAVIFEAGFSTADTVSQIAGRGVGLDAVRSDIAALGGRIDVSNVVGMGAMFNIYLPVTLSVAQVVMVRVANKTFAIPSVMVEQVQKLKQPELLKAYEAHRIDWAGREYPLHFLAKLIGDVDHIAQHHIYTPVLLLRSGTYRTAVHVDDIIGNQEVVMKAIGTQLTHVPGMIGATVLGDGAIVLVVNPVQLANREALSIGAVKVTTFAPVVEETKRVALVVDDSLTMRKVLSRLLEREDFEVITANDGMDAIQKLQLHTPDIILTDIEMPRMDGFEFSRHVRDNVKTSKVPLIVISSRTAEKHRNVASQLGVNAFLGKPVQDDELIQQVNGLLKK